MLFALINSCAISPSRAWRGRVGTGLECRTKASVYEMQPIRCTRPRVRPEAADTEFLLLHKDSTDDVVEEAIAWCYLHGLVIGQGTGVRNAATLHAPFTLSPTEFPAADFHTAEALMPLFSSLIHTVSRDLQYLSSTLWTTAETDSFTRQLLGVLLRTEGSRLKNGSPVALGLHRSDYMRDEPSGKLLQVELNTIAVGCGALSSRLNELHAHLLSRHFRDARSSCGNGSNAEHFPRRDTLTGLAKGLSEANSAFCSLHHIPLSDALQVMVVQPQEWNVFDQMWLQDVLWRDKRIVMIRKTLAQVSEQGTVDESGHMRIGGKVVSVFYLRAGYSPDDYPGQAEWAAREAMESCSAISCPSVAYQLVGAKKIQQDLASPGRLESFVEQEADAEMMRKCFAGLWSLDNTSEESTQTVMQAAISNPQDFVLKPQREGGGNNLYGSELADALSQGGNNLVSYVLMQRIKPTVNKSTALVRNGKCIYEDTISEFGVFGVFLEVSGRVVLNESSGYLMRTKPVSSDEGGVSTGVGVLDSPILV